MNEEIMNNFLEWCEEEVSNTVCNAKNDKNHIERIVERFKLIAPLLVANIHDDAH